MVAGISGPGSGWTEAGSGEDEVPNPPKPPELPQPAKASTDMMAVSGKARLYFPITALPTYMPAAWRPKTQRPAGNQDPSGFVPRHG